MKRKDFGSYKEFLSAIIEERSKVLQERTDKYIRDSKKILDVIVEDTDKVWLEQFVVGENGLDIACGDFPLARGVDIRLSSIGYDYLYSGDKLDFQSSNTLDFIITNWFDVFPAPLPTLVEWQRCLKQGGVLALVTKDVNLYDGHTGPLESRHRLTLFCEKSLRFYLHKAGFTEVVIEQNLVNKSLRAKAKALKSVKVKVKQ